MACRHEPRFAERILEELVDLSPDGSITLDQRYFAYLRGRRTVNRRFEELFGHGRLHVVGLFDLEITDQVVFVGRVDRGDRVEDLVAPGSVGDVAPLTPA